MTIVTDAIAELTSQLVRVVDAPSGELGFGSDLSCGDDITPDAAELPGDSILAVAQANYRRLNTPRGRVPDDPEYGIDLCAFLHEPMTSHRQDELGGIIRSELRKDDRNDPDSLSVQIEASLRGLKIAIQGKTETGTFSMTMALENGAMLLKEIAANGNA
jgi:hypothetical protein